MALDEDLDALERIDPAAPDRVGQVLQRAREEAAQRPEDPLEALIRRYANAEIRNNTERFRYQTLTARYNTLQRAVGARSCARARRARPSACTGSRRRCCPRRRPRAAPARRRAGRRGAQRTSSACQNPERDADDRARPLRAVPGGARAERGERARQVRELPEAHRPAGLAHPHRQGRRRRWSSGWRPRTARSSLKAKAVK